MKHTETYDHYYLYSEIEEKMRGYAGKYPRYTKLDELGTTPEGRKILLLEITDTACGDFSDKPAFYTEGNIHAGEVTGSMTVMCLMDTVFSNLNDPNIKELLADRTLYLLPRVSPDGSEYYLTTPYSVRSVNRPYPYTESLPGLYPKDMDGDGAIRSMRVKSPYGIWKKSEKDPRLMVRRSPDDRSGEFYHVYREGEIRDYDGLGVKSAPDAFGKDFNRSYPYAWKPEWDQKGAGNYPLEDPETKANADFILAHPNICLVVDMHTSGGMILYTPGHKSRKDAEPADIAIYRALGKMASEESGFPLMNVYDEYSVPSNPATWGGFDDFCHFLIGIPAFTIECWDLDARAGISMEIPPSEETDEEKREENEEKTVRWLDENLPEGEGFRDWKKVQHPQLGEVEIGGICEKFTRQNPPTAFLEQEAEKHVRFMLRAVNALPKIIFEKTSAEKLGEGLYRIEAVIGNTAFLPSYVFKEGLKNRKMDGLTVSCRGGEVIGQKEDIPIGHLEGFSSVRTGWGLPACSAETDPVRKKVSWIVKAKEKTAVRLTCSGDRIGKISRELILP